MKTYEPISFKFTPEAAETLRAMGGAAAGTLLKAVQALIAEGIAAKLARQRKPISRQWLAELCTWPGMLSLAEEVLDARCRENGLAGPRQCTHRFVPVPSGTQWAEPARKVFIVLADDWDLNSRGETIKRAAGGRRAAGGD